MVKDQNDKGEIKHLVSLAKHAFGKRKIPRLYVVGVFSFSKMKAALKMFKKS